MTTVSIPGGSGGGGGGIVFRAPPDEFTGATVAACRTARNTFFDATANSAALGEFQNSQFLAIILNPTGANNNVFETYSAGNTVGDAHDNTEWVERTGAFAGNDGSDGVDSSIETRVQATNSATAPTVDDSATGWSTTASATTSNPYFWRIVRKGSVGSIPAWSTIAPELIGYRSTDGIDGDDANIETRWQITSSDTAPTVNSTASGWTTSPGTMDATNRFLWTITRFGLVGSLPNWNTITPALVGRWGVDGDEGPGGMQEIFDATGKGPQARTADNITRVGVDTLNEIVYFTREDIVHTGTEPTGDFTDFAEANFLGSAPIGELLDENPALGEYFYDTVDHHWEEWQDLNGVENWNLISLEDATDSNHIWIGGKASEQEALNHVKNFNTGNTYVAYIRATSTVRVLTNSTFVAGTGTSTAYTTFPLKVADIEIVDISASHAPPAPSEAQSHEWYYDWTIPRLWIPTLDKQADTPADVTSQDYSATLFRGVAQGITGTPDNAMANQYFYSVQDGAFIQYQTSDNSWHLRGFNDIADFDGAVWVGDRHNDGAAAAHIDDYDSNTDYYFYSRATHTIRQVLTYSAPLNEHLVVGYLTIPENPPVETLIDERVNNGAILEDVAALSGNHAAALTTITLTAAPSSAIEVGDFIGVNHERMLVTAVAGTSLTVTRAVFGTDAEEHGGAAGVDLLDIGGGRIIAPRTWTYDESTHSNSYDLGRVLDSAESGQFLNVEFSWYSPAAKIHQPPSRITIPVDDFITLDDHPLLGTSTHDTRQEVVLRQDHSGLTSSNIAILLIARHRLTAADETAGAGVEGNDAVIVALSSSETDSLSRVQAYIYLSHDDGGAGGSGVGVGDTIASGPVAFKASFGNKTGNDATSFTAPDDVMEIFAADVDINVGGFTIDGSLTNISRVVVPKAGLYEVGVSMLLSQGNIVTERTVVFLRFLIDRGGVEIYSELIGGGYLRGQPNATQCIASGVILEDLEVGDKIGIQMINTAGNALSVDGPNSHIDFALITGAGGGSGSSDSESGQEEESSGGISSDYVDASGEKQIKLYRAMANTNAPGEPAAPHDGTDFVTSFNNWYYDQDAAIEAITDPVIVWEADGGFSIASDATVSVYEWELVPQLSIQYTDDVSNNNAYTFTEPLTGRYWQRLVMHDIQNGGIRFSPWIADGYATIVSEEFWYTYYSNYPGDVPFVDNNTFTAGVWSPTTPGNSSISWYRTQAAAADNGDDSETLWILHRRGSLNPVGIVTVDAEIQNGWWIEYADDANGSNSSTTYDEDTHHFIAFRLANGSLTEWFNIGVRFGDAVWEELMSDAMHATTPNGVRTRPFVYDMSRYHALRFTAYSFSFINNQRTNFNVIRQTVLDRPEDGWPIRDTSTATAQQDNEEFQCFYDHVGGLHVGILQEVNPLIEAAWYGPTQTSGVYIQVPLPPLVLWRGRPRSERHIGRH